MVAGVACSTTTRTATSMLPGQRCRDPVPDQDLAGLLEPPLPQQPRRHIHRCHGKGRRQGSGYGMGVAVGDYDNDGWPDIFVATSTATSSSTTTATAPSPTSPPGRGVGGASSTAKKCGPLGAAGSTTTTTASSICSSRTTANGRSTRIPSAARTPACAPIAIPRIYAPLPNTLYRNNGDGTFTDVSDETGIAQVYGKGMGVSFADYDRDGFMESSWPTITPQLPVPQPRGQEVRGDRRAGRRRLSTTSGNAISGMGSDFADVEQRRLGRHLAHRHRARDVPLYPQPQRRRRLRRDHELQRPGPRHAPDVGLEQRHHGFR